MEQAFRTKIVGCVTVPFLIIVIGCESGMAVRENRTIADLCIPVVYETAEGSPRPAWTSQTTFYEDETGFHFTGGVMGGSDYALTIRLAKSEALKNLLESIEIKARSEFSSAIHGNDTTEEGVGRSVTDAVAWTVENLRVSGIKQRNVFCEQTFDPSNHRVRYNAWVNLSIAKDDYRAATIGVAEKLLNRAIQERDEEAKHTARELLERLRTES